MRVAVADAGTTAGTFKVAFAACTGTCSAGSGFSCSAAGSGLSVDSVVSFQTPGAVGLALAAVAPEALTSAVASVDGSADESVDEYVDVDCRFGDDILNCGCG